MDVDVDTDKTQNQRHSQNAEQVMQIKGRPLDQAMLLFKCVPKGANSFLYEQFLIVWKITYHIKLPPMNVTIFITHVGNLRNGYYANENFRP